jgi:phosphoglycolate phosphatase-like HAD superfamily hydrolase
MKPLLVAWDFNGVLNTFSDQVAPLLEQLQSSGAEHIIVSSSMAGTIEHYLQQHGLASYFSQVYGFAPTTLAWVGDSSDMKQQNLQHHIHKFGPFQRIITIGDNESDMRAGQSVGAECILHGHLSTSLNVKHSTNLDELKQILLPHQ